MNDFKILSSRLMEWGAGKVGCSYVEDKLPEQYRRLKYAVTVIVRLSDFIVNEIADCPTYTYFHHYRSVNSLIDHITLRGTLAIEEMGYYAMAVAASQSIDSAKGEYSGVFPHKTAAVRAGMGWIGKNGLLVTDEYGPRLRLGTILTDMPLPVENLPGISKCGDCSTCVEACPATAITGKNWTEGCERSELLDAGACSRYMKSKFHHIGRGVVCGLCVKCCPRGTQVQRK